MSKKFDLNEIIKFKGKFRIMGHNAVTKQFYIESVMYPTLFCAYVEAKDLEKIND